MYKAINICENKKDFKLFPFLEKLIVKFEKNISINRYIFLTSCMKLFVYVIDEHKINRNYFIKIVKET